MLKQYFELDENVRNGLLHPSFGQKALALENKIRGILNMPPASCRKNLH